MQRQSHRIRVQIKKSERVILISTDLLQGKIHSRYYGTLLELHFHGTSAFAFGTFKDATIGQSPNQVCNHRPDETERCGNMWNDLDQILM